MRRLLLTAAVSGCAVTMLASCGGGSGGSGATPAPSPAPIPAPTPVPPTPPARVVPFFDKPFAGEYVVGNFFDHSVPKEFVDTNGTFVTFWTKPRQRLRRT